MKPTSICCNQHTTSEDLLWSTADVANYLRCSERQVFNLRQQGLPAVQVGGLIRFIPSRVRDWLDARDNGTETFDERAHQLADVAHTGDEDNAEVCCDELERQSFEHRDKRDQDTERRCALLSGQPITTGDD